MLKMDSPTEATPDNKTSVKRMAIILILAFLGSQLNLFVALGGQIAGGLLDPNNSGGGLFSLFSYDLAAGIKLAAIVFLFAWVNFLMLSLYPEHGWRQTAAGFLGATAWVVGHIAGNFLDSSLPYGYDPTVSLQIIGVLIAIPICLLVSGRVKRLADLAGLELGLLIGMGLCMIALGGMALILTTLPNLIALYLTPTIHKTWIGIVMLGTILFVITTRPDMMLAVRVKTHLSVVGDRY
jgi:hypothetical protein